MSSSSPVKKAYQALLSRGRLQPNKGQVELVRQLGLLQNRLIQGGSRQSSQSDKILSFNNPLHYKSKGGGSGSTSNNVASAGIYIYGGVGTGKSRIADLFTATLPDEIPRRRAHFFEFMTDMHMRLHQARSQADYQGDPLVRIGRDIQKESAVLCLDEFQVSDIADAMILKRLFGSFWDCGGIMVATSNRHPTELYKDGLNRPLFIPFIEELQRRCQVFQMQGHHDYRMDDSDHTTPRRETFLNDPVKFDKELARELASSALQALEVNVVMGRNFTVQAAQSIDANGDKPTTIVSTTFQDLCETPFGAADYHALCAKAGSIYMRGLRKFAADELDIVRRFIVLVDVAYESRTKVICLSSDSLLTTFENIVDPSSLQRTINASQEPPQKHNATNTDDKNLKVRREGGSSSSMMSTFVGETEWSATGLKEASLATGGAGEKDVRFAIRRAISRLTEMGSSTYTVKD